MVWQGISLGRKLQKLKFKEEYGDQQKPDLVPLDF
jgi:hypothetical protein